MKLSTKGRYGLRAMIYLAANRDSGYIPLYMIAEAEDISERYLEQVFSSLKKSGIVKSVKGARGGYFLTKENSEISVYDILYSIEGDLSIVDNMPDDTLIKRCINTCVWEKVNGAIFDVTTETKLDVLVEKYKKVRGHQEIMYYI
ncbi:MAG: Rrf2 family transcriptional regulator [Clostridium sp.]|uniref:RrF2 family transcriptional regulator n=1 Tax=Clostridium sp. TaxID=1506 RepID=UPI002FCA9F47